MNWVMSYPQMRAANVLGTAEVLQLATKHHLKVVHYVSTVSTAPTHGDETSVMPHEHVLRASGFVLAASTLGVLCIYVTVVPRCVAVAVLSPGMSRRRALLKRSWPQLLHRECLPPSSALRSSATTPRAATATPRTT